METYTVSYGLSTKKKSYRIDFTGIFRYHQGMLINTGGRTDLVACYTPWLIQRFREGVVMVRNPYDHHAVSRYRLDPSVVDGVVFCSKDYRPIIPFLGEIFHRFPTYFHFTITAYGRDIEPNVPDIPTSIHTLLELEKLVGSRRISWRYDPILLTPTYPVQRHLETFSYLAETLKGHVDRCIFSFVQIYPKLRHTFPSLEAVSQGDKERLAQGMGEIARKAGIPLQICGSDEDFSRFGILPSGCLTLPVLGRANGITFPPHPHRGMRPGCHCVESRDIGAYGTCTNGCRYCYATSDFAKAARMRSQNNPASPLLIGEIGPKDHITDAKQVSFGPQHQPSLFD
jgi:hypothetical protein